ncbi:MAG: hypothetical protein ACYTFQ_25745, partial [Planctomycetota bacterium]
DANQAVGSAERAAGLTGHRDASVLETLAAAYAAAGRSDRAITTMQEAIELASAGEDRELADYLRRQLDTYKNLDLKIGN